MSVYYKVTSAGISCVRSQSPGFSVDDLSNFPSFFTSFEIVLVVRGPLSHQGDANMAISGHTTDSAVIATMTVGTVLGCLAVAARLFTRIVIVRKAGWDDAIICAGCVSVAMLVLLDVSLTLPRSSAYHILSLLARGVSALQNAQIGILLTTVCSGVWNGSTLLDPQ